MSKTCRILCAFSWGNFSWTEMICVKKLTFCNSAVLGILFMIHSLETVYSVCSVCAPQVMCRQKCCRCNFQENQPIPASPPWPDL